MKQYDRSILNYEIHNKEIGAYTQRMQIYLEHSKYPASF